MNGVDGYVVRGRGDYASAGIFLPAAGATVSADTMPTETFGCLVWVEKLDGSPESMATFFHELVHDSALRFARRGVFRRNPRPRDVSSGLASFDGLMANSVSELGAAFLGMLCQETKSGEE